MATDFYSRFTSFDKLIATDLIRYLYWVGAGVIVIASLFGILGAAVAAFNRSSSEAFLALIMIPIAAAIALLFWRFLCEIWIVIFGIYDRLGEISAKLEK